MIRLQKMLIIGMVVVIRYRSTERNTVVRVGESKTLARKRVLGEEHPFMGNLVSTTRIKDGERRPRSWRCKG